MNGLSPKRLFEHSSIDVAPHATKPRTMKRAGRKPERLPQQVQDEQLGLWPFNAASIWDGDQFSTMTTNKPRITLSVPDDDEICLLDNGCDDAWTGGLDAPSSACSVLSSGGSAFSSVVSEAPVQRLYRCFWAGCQSSGFTSRNEWAWHVKAEHMLECPICAECCSNANEVLIHVALQHPDCSKGIAAKEWELPLPSVMESTSTDSDVAGAKARYRDKVQERVVKRAQMNKRGASSATEAEDSRVNPTIEAATFGDLFEHAIRPFLAEFMPSWSGPRHVLALTRGKTPELRCISVMAAKTLSRSRKLMIAQHVFDLLPDDVKHRVSFSFSTGQINRMLRWARGLDASRPDHVTAARNPYYFSLPCMGDSIGIDGGPETSASTATLGPCLDVGDNAYWLVNFHPFLEAWQSPGEVRLEHPSPQDRAPCLAEGHDALLVEDGAFRLGPITVTSGLTLKTTRISHDPYWEENDLDPALVVTDWALVGASASNRNRANMLRRFPSEAQPPCMEPMARPVCTRAAGIVAGASVVSSGRTSGFQRGQICEVPAYVSGAENGTGKATREWFVEEACGSGSEEDSWIRGGIGVEGDSGAAVVDADTNCLYGQLWGRNKYWGPGPRITFFTPLMDIFDDIQEKCGLQKRPQLPELRPDGERFAEYPSCRACYDARTYFDSRRSSRVSLQSMINYRGEAEHDLLSNDNVSELATPRDFSNRGGRAVGEPGLSFIGAAVSHSPAMFGFSAASPTPTQVPSPYPQTLIIDNNSDSFTVGDVMQEAAAATAPQLKTRRVALFPGEPSSASVRGVVSSSPKRQRTA
ncbi:Zinc finger, C2H2-like protein [Moelleriella libera RCEF 2490]|uniref:Zinc finger, C2H2-like protein n=1 Tax=Moelleriella libera RCEF 2490 TaxID=1081109 RepID=A0A167ZDF0_9HYPO|nr:Zinc finger, C2H2-like protein [Moelleriella libera RCEF 2490]